MSSDLTELHEWAGELLAKLQPAQRRQLTRKVGQDLRRSQAKRIAAQQNPDGTPYTPRKRKNLRGKKGRIKRKKGRMFEKMRAAKHMKLQNDANQITIGFIDQVGRVARIHHYGLRDRISSKVTSYQYPERRLLGFGQEDQALICDSLLHHLA